MARITLLPGPPCRVNAGLSIAVVEIVEKRLTDGRGMMRVKLALQMPDETDAIELSSEAPAIEWRRWRVVYLGGWRHEVQLDLQPLD